MHVQITYVPRPISVSSDVRVLGRSPSSGLGINGRYFMTLDFFNLAGRSGS